jgi:hypothetical protein
MEFFPAIVSKARTIDVLANGMAGRSESLVLVNKQQSSIHRTVHRWLDSTSNDCSSVRRCTRSCT